MKDNYIKSNKQGKNSIRKGGKKTKPLEITLTLKKKLHELYAKMHDSLLSNMETELHELKNTLCSQQVRQIMSIPPLISLI